MLFSKSRNEDNTMTFCERILMFNSQISLYCTIGKQACTRGIRWGCTVKKEEKAHFKDTATIKCAKILRKSQSST